jgi:hypothetical protein
MSELEKDAQRAREMVLSERNEAHRHKKTLLTELSQAHANKELEVALYFYYLLSHLANM